MSVPSTCYPLIGCVNIGQKTCRAILGECEAMAAVSMCLLVLSKVSSGPGSMQFGPDSLVVIGCQRHSCEMGLDPGAGYGQ